MISDEMLYEILSDYFSFSCEEDSWEKSQDLDEWSTDQMWAYYVKYIGEE